MADSASRLTRRQAEVYAFLRRHADAGKPPPSLDEICRALSLRSRGSLHKHIRALVDAGLIEDPGGKQRGIRMAAEPAAARGVPPAVRVPLLGRIAAGQPLEAVNAPEEVEIPSSMRGERPCYVLRVRGDSMIEDGILDGDLVIVESREDARNGEIVVALVDGGEATLKRIVQRPGEIELWPANAAMAPLRFAPERVQIQGVVIGQMRSYR